MITIVAKGDRITQGQISVIKEKCPHCNHNKAWVKNAGVFCTKCSKRVYEKTKKEKAKEDKSKKA